MEAQAEYEKLEQGALRPRREDEPVRLALCLALGALTGLRSHDLLRAIALLSSPPFSFLRYPPSVRHSVARGLHLRASLCYILPTQVPQTLATSACQF